MVTLTLRKIAIWLSKNCQKLDIFFKKITIEAWTELCCRSSVSPLLEILSPFLMLGKHTTKSSSPGKPKNNASKLPVKTPTLHGDMTSQQYRKFIVDWNAFCTMTDLLDVDDMMQSQLYSCTDDVMQCAILSTYPMFFFLSTPDNITWQIETNVTQRANTMVSRMSFQARS